MTSYAFALAVVFAIAPAVTARAQSQTAASAATDVYHVHFAKAAPGQAAALGENLMKPDTATPMPTHFIVLRHQEGDDWDYCTIQHIGTTATVAVGAAPQPNAPALNAWHSDSYVAGPSWAEFSRALGLTSSAQTTGSIYVVSVQRPVPGHRAQLEQSLTPDSSSKVAGHVTLVHIEGGPWTFLSVNRYNSWQDFAADRAAAVQRIGSSKGSDGWSESRQHVAYHTDTIADRTYPR